MPRRRQESKRPIPNHAGKYCRLLENRYLRRRGRRELSLLNELRRFYRLPLQAKIRRIDFLN